MNKRLNDKCIRNDSGFSLVELIVCVSVLAIASVVLMKSFSMAAIVNSKAQRKQSATSMAESVMEEIKSSGIKNLQKKYNGGADTVVTVTGTDADYSVLSAAALAKVPDPTPPATETGKLLTGSDADNAYYALVKKGVTSTKGEKFNVTAIMRTKPYAVAKNDSASDANSIKLPVIEEIDTHTKTVLTKKELNKFDIAAQDYFRDHTVTPGAAPLSTKEIIIQKEGNGAAGAGSSVEVKCTVRYTATDGSKYSKEVFRGTYVSQKDKAGNQLPVDNGIYIFYNRFLSTTPTKESIQVIDKSTNDDHKTYLIFQDDLYADADPDNDVVMDDLNGTKVTINNGSTNVISATTNGAINFDDDGETVYGIAKRSGYTLITNLGQSAGSEGSILEKKKKNRVFEVTVTVNSADNSEELAKITSTVDVRE